MYDLLIVEDEDIIRNGLIKIIKKSEVGFDRIAGAANGLAALGCVDRKRPDVVITDIKMPKMDGLEFIRALREMQIGVPVVILSGYGEFGYAQQAIAYGVSDYLLKPVKKGELKRVLSQIVARLDEDRRRSRQLHAEKTELAGQIGELQTIVLQDILQGQYPPQECGALLHKTGLNFGTGHFLILEAACHDADSDRMRSIMAEIRKIISLLASILFEYTDPYGHRIVLIKLNASGHNILEHADSLSHQLSSFFATPGMTKPYLGISGLCDHPDGLSACCRQAKEALALRIFNPGDSVFRFVADSQTPHAKALPPLYYESISKLVCSGGAESEPALRKAVDELFGRILCQEGLTPKQLLEYLRNLFFYTLKLEANEPANELDEFDAEDLFQASRNVSDLKEQVIQKLILISGNMKRYGDLLNNTIGYILAFIDDNYAKDLCLDWAANHVSMNPNYFCYLFKSKMGLSFTNYLQKVRVEKAKTFLQNPNNKVYDVSKKVGFNDDKYFCKVFKKITGMTPNEFRNKAVQKL